MTQPPSNAPRRERAVNAPWPAAALAGALLALYALQGWIGPDWPQRFGLRPSELFDGGWPGLIAHIGLHGGWLHAGMNAVGALAFGAPLARRLGDDPRGAAAFGLFFLVTGIATGLVYALVRADSQAVLIGASGAVFALIGAATRLMNRFGGIEPLLSRRVLTMTAVWVGSNLLIAVLGFDPATGIRSIAWEAHLIGLAVGLLLVGPWMRLFARRTNDPGVIVGPWGRSGPEH